LGSKNARDLLQIFLEGRAESSSALGLNSWGGVLDRCREHQRVSLQIRTFSPSTHEQRVTCHNIIPPLPRHLVCLTGLWSRYSLIGCLLQQVFYFFFFFWQSKETSVPSGTDGKLRGVGGTLSSSHARRNPPTRPLSHFDTEPASESKMAENCRHLSFPPRSVGLQARSARNTAAPPTA
jgi:hypothetical protein